MEKGSDSRVKGDFAHNDNQRDEQKPMEPVNKNYDAPPEESNRCWKGVKVNYQTEIMPDKNGRLGF